MLSKALVFIVFLVVGTSGETCLWLFGVSWESWFWIWGFILLTMAISSDIGIYGVQVIGYEGGMVGRHLVG